MTKAPINHGKSWSASDNRQLRQLVQGNTPTRVIALKMGRTPGAVQSHASAIDVALKPTNQSPYGTQG